MSTTLLPGDLTVLGTPVPENIALSRALVLEASGKKTRRRTPAPAGIQFSNLGDLTEKMFGKNDIPGAKHLHNIGCDDFTVRVICVSNIPPRDPRFQYIIDMGVPFYEHIFAATGELRGGITLMFPERWCSVQEQRFLWDKIVAHPNRSQLTHVDITTSSPLVLGCFTHKVVWAQRDDEIDIKNVERGMR